ncbi:lambda-crystallin [Roseibium sp. TrichSKD4]|uniref:3-hydroxyacyl-CoA dehydrogenase n=1 Tax=Roseibium sp. TrichSKD4 TaxID=744980 RepID=UPI0001E56D03|nr:3-hydroxyacyl-CoA dehydrogenase [Roseibium sp. TrichSKD4]EFO30217.1 lambda-crystallin [Roseibium sp. TrichSKD4]
MEKVAVVGAGLIGQGWAAVFAQAGYQVTLHDVSENALDKALSAMQTRIGDMAEYDLIDRGETDVVLSRITASPSLEGALDGAVYVQENGPENVDIKRELTTRIDAIAAPGVPICSSTSGISASRYCENIAGRNRCLVAHPINPPHLIPAVEIVPTPWTVDEVVARVRGLLIRCKRQTITLTKEIDGFVVNRLQGALLEEAFKLVGSGIVSVEDLDKAICDGLGLRWSFMGPMQTIHLNAPGGVTQYVERYAAMYRGFGVGPQDAADWTKVVEGGLARDLEQKTPIKNIAQAQVERDRSLMALLRDNTPKRDA